jgi:hypothetical protein
MHGHWPASESLVPLTAIFHPTTPGGRGSGEWSPAHSLDDRGRYTTLKGDLVLVWVGDPTARAAAQTRNAVFWYLGQGYRSAPRELLPDTGDGVLRGVFTRPGGKGDGLTPADVAGYNTGVSGGWDYAVRLDRSRALVAWHGSVPCEVDERGPFLLASVVTFSLEGVQYPDTSTRYRPPLGVNPSAPLPYALVTVHEQPDPQRYLSPADKTLGRLVSRDRLDVARQSAPPPTTEHYRCEPATHSTASTPATEPLVMSLWAVIAVHGVVLAVLVGIIVLTVLAMRKARVSKQP